MKNNFFKIGLMSLALGVGFSSYAVPAKPGLRTVRTADGKEISVRLVGDEYFHQYFTEDGYPLEQRDGSFYYCDVDAQGKVVESGIVATQIDERDAAAHNFLCTVNLKSLDSRLKSRAALSPRKIAFAERMNNLSKAPRKVSGNDGPPYEMGYGLFPGTSFPAYGDQKVIVILVEYTDIKFKTNYEGGISAHDYFTDMLNKDNFSSYGGTGSVAQYFRENSNGAFTPEFDLYGPLTLANKRSYYGGNDSYGNDKHPEEMVIEACKMLDSTVDFSQYDRDGDGIIDNVYVIYAGVGEASSDVEESVWPHSWSMDEALQSNLMFDGVRLNTYGCSNEWEESKPDGIGTFVHEFSHVLGLPDLYATNYSSAFTPSEWSVLDYGPYNNDGRTPPSYSAFERYALGWIKPREVASAVSATLPVNTENVCGIIRTSKDTEFFLLENRQQNGWDKYIPGHGMLVWHIDYNANVWTQNSVNNSSSHQYVDLMEADGTRSESSRAGDAFPGTSKVTSFTSETTPAMKTWSGQKLDYPITDIAESNGVITFNVLGGLAEIPAVEVYDAEVLSQTSAKLSWKTIPGYEAIINVYTHRAKESADKEYLDGYTNRNVGQVSEFVVEGLNPGTQYYYTVELDCGWNTTGPSEEKGVNTDPSAFENCRVIVLDADNVTTESFRANWQPLEGATSYLLTVNRYSLIGANEAVQDFTDGVNTYGWTSDSSTTYAMEQYVGESAPSLRLTKSQTLTSPVYPEDISKVTFWHNGNNTGAEDVINVYAVGEEQTLIKAVTAVAATEGTTTELTEIPAGTRQVMFEYIRTGASGSVAIDDIKIEYGEVYEDVPLENYIDLNVGNVTNALVEGLENETGYYYTVKATNGEASTRSSERTYVVTGGTSGIINAIGDKASAVRVSGKLVTAGEGEDIVVCDYSGAVVARGRGFVTLPGRGLYIVTVPSRGYAAKIMAK